MPESILAVTIPGKLKSLFDCFCSLILWLRSIVWTPWWMRIHRHCVAKLLQQSAAQYGWEELHFQYRKSSSMAKQSRVIDMLKDIN